MVVKEDTQVLARIGFAQRWLDRARRQCTDGHLARSALTLVLAGAEVRHALEAAGAPVRAQARRMSPTALLVVAAGLISAFLLAAHWPAQSGIITSPVPPLLRLSSSSGALLEAMSALNAVPGSAPSVAGATVTSRRPPAPRYTGAPATLDTAGGHHSLATGGTPVGIGSSHISMSELIDLVLTAERALRQEPAGTSSP